jgi:excisionase family DNA binding protein
MTTELNISRTAKFSPTQAARVLELHRSTIYRLVERGEMKVINLKSGGFKIPGSEMIRYFNTH